MNRKTLYRLIVTALMAAMVFVATNLRITIPTPLGNTMLHLGNVMCLLSGMLFGPVIGGLSAGTGSGFFDLFSEYAAEAPITFMNKFAMGFVTGLIARPKGKEGTRTRRAVAAVAGALTYVVLYIGKTVVTNYFILGVEWQTVLATVYTKGTVSLANAAIAVVASVTLCEILLPLLKKAGVFNTLEGR